MNYDRLSSELLRALRGKRSQAALGRRLGYRANVSYLWESGRRFPPAGILFRLAALSRVSPERVAEFAACTELATLGKRAWSASDTALLVRALCGEVAVVDVARLLRVDRTTVARWLRGATEPRVPELLALIDAMTHRLLEFVALFADPTMLDSVAELARDLAAQRRTAYELPWSHAVLRALELEAYRALPSHEEGVIARAIGIEVSEETRLLGELRAARLIRRRRGKWVLSRVLTVDTRADPRRDRTLKQHWAEVGLLRLRRSEGPTEAFHSYNLMAVSHSDFARLKELHVEYYERVRRIVAESNLAERVVLLNQQLIPLDG